MVPITEGSLFKAVLLFVCNCKNIKKPQPNFCYDFMKITTVCNIKKRDF